MARPRKSIDEINPDSLRHNRKRYAGRLAAKAEEALKVLAPERMSAEEALELIDKILGSYFAE
jgi:hypothetical protein